MFLTDETNAHTHTHTCVCVCSLSNVVYAVSIVDNNVYICTVHSYHDVHYLYAHLELNLHKQDKFSKEFYISL